LIIILLPDKRSQAQTSETRTWITGTLIDQQNQFIAGAHITLLETEEEQPLAEASTQPDGRYTLSLPTTIPSTLLISNDRAHFKETQLMISSEVIDTLEEGETLVIPAITVKRQITLGFWIATAIFLLVLVLIATGILHNTLAALVGAALLFSISYLGHPLYEGFYIFDFVQSLKYIDWNVIFLIMGLMIVIAVIENTGIFQWLAFFAYKVSGGKTGVLLLILMLITGVASAFLDNVTTMLLMTPITVQIAISIGINPLALLVPEVMASNVIGVSTLVGTPQTF
jgi:TRAP-type C4-dicarboxylate transport system permease large subunit